MATLHFDDASGQLVNVSTDNPLPVTPGGSLDSTNDVLKVEQQFSSVLVTSDTAVKGSAGFLHSITFSPNDATPTAGTIIVYDNTAESGTQIFNWSVAATAFIPFTVTINRVCATGIYVGFTTTADVNVSVSYR